jgi:hypothetical protein
MKILGTIALGFVVLIAGLICLLSSLCAVSRGVAGGARTTYAMVALVSMGIAIGAVMAIGKINRKE